MSAFPLLLGPVRLIGPHRLETPALGVKARAALAFLATQPNRKAGRDRPEPVRMMETRRAALAA